MNVIDSLNAQTGMVWKATPTDGYYVCTQEQYRYIVGLSGPGYVVRIEVYEQAGWSGVDIARQSLPDALDVARRMMGAR